MLIRKTQRGFTLIELMIAVIIFGVLLALGMPAYQNWIARTKVRVTAETLVAGLSTARNHSLHRNSQVIFSLTSSLAADCARTNTATNWIVSLADPSGSCDAAPSEDDAPRIIEKRSGGEGTSRASISALTAANNPATNVIFTGLGRVLLQDAAGNAMNPISRINISYPDGGTCQANGGTVRCLRIEITTGGAARMCDPAVADANDPRACA